MQYSCALPRSCSASQPYQTAGIGAAWSLQPSDINMAMAMFHRQGPALPCSSACHCSGLRQFCGMAVDLPHDRAPSLLSICQLPPAEVAALSSPCSWSVVEGLAFTTACLGVHSIRCCCSLKCVVARRGSQHISVIAPQEMMHSRVGTVCGTAFLLFLRDIWAWTSSIWQTGG